MRFVAARLSFAPIAQQTLFQKSFAGSSIELAEDIMQSHTHYSPARTGLGFVMGSFLLDHGVLLGAKVGILRDVVLGKYDEESRYFFEKRDDSYQTLVLLWDRAQQVILLERKTSVLRRPEKLFEHLEVHLNRHLSEYGIYVAVRVIPQANKFWRSIKKYEYIHRVRFTLSVPNLFGNTQKSLKEWLRECQEETNATEVTNEFANPDGRLRLNPEDEKLQDGVEWTEKGAGEWTVVGSHDQKKKVTIKSTSSAKRIETQLDLENYDADEVHKILKDLRFHYEVDTNSENGDDV